TVSNRGGAPLRPSFKVPLERWWGAVGKLDSRRPWHRPGPVFGAPRRAPYRLGQRSFQAVVLDAYHRRCAVSGTHIPLVLQAAPIRPITAGGEHRLDNRLLLRSDIHTLFDRGYLAVDPGFRLLVSPRLRQDFQNGDQFYARAGQVIDLPDHRADRPNRDFLEWHLDEVFKASLEPAGSASDRSQPSRAAPAWSHVPNTCRNRVDARLI